MKNLLKCINKCTSTISLTYDRCVVNPLVTGFYRSLFFVQGRSRFSPQYKKYVVSRKDFDKPRTPGIAGYYKVKNEESFLAASIDSYLPYLDEIVIVYSGSTDRTPQIAESYARQFPDKVKVYHYEPHVYPPFSKEHIGTPPHSPHSFVNYNNYALLKTTKENIVIIDGDHIAVTESLKTITDKIRSEGLSGMLRFSGVNVYTNDGKYYVHERTPFTSGYDHWFFPISSKTYFKHHRKWELLTVPRKMKRERQWIGVLFYHLRGVKPDRGISNYGTNTKIARTHQEDVMSNAVMSWDEAQSGYESLRTIPDPNTVLALQVLASK